MESADSMEDSGIDSDQRPIKIGSVSLPETEIPLSQDLADDEVGSCVDKPAVIM